MKIINDKELINNLKLSEESELSGSYGKIIEINDKELLKTYYRLFKLNTKTCTKEELEKSINEIKTLKTNGTMSYRRILADKQRIETLIKILNNTSSKDLIKDYLIYKDLVVSLILTNYKDYETYENLIINNNLSKQEHKEILKQIKEKVNELVNNRLYPLDLKFDNIMVNKETLDVKLIDLDDLGTIYLDDTHIKNYQKSVKFKLDNMEYKILKK